jgi:hypothetical protein
MAKIKVTEIQKGPDAPVGAETGTNQGAMSADEIAAAETAKATAGEQLAAATPETTKADDKKPKQAKSVPGVRITAKVASFRRAGLAFGLTPVDITISELSKDQIEALASEPMLTCEPIEFPVEAGNEKD